MTPPEEYMPTPTVRIVETPYEGPFFCIASPQKKINIDSHCWGCATCPIHSSAKCAPTALHALEPVEGELVVQSPAFPTALAGRS